jgi:hypothetical protein
MSATRYRALAYGRVVGPTMSAQELESFEASLLAHCAAGLADPDELVIERRDSGGAWRVDRVLDWTEGPMMFSNPNGGGDD